MNYCYANVSILFADDMTSSRNHYAEYLGHLFHDVYEASDGEEVWKLYKEHRPDILLLDVEMPKMNGLDVAAKIRAVDKQTRIIIATAYVNEGRLLQAVELGLTRFLPKPFGRKILQETLEKAVLELDDRHYLDLGSGYRWNSSMHELHCDEALVRLTTSERALLSLFFSKPGQIFSNYTIELHLWPLDNDDDTAPRLKALIKRIRKKLPEGCIENAYGEGYRLHYSR